MNEKISILSNIDPDTNYCNGILELRSPSSDLKYLSIDSFNDIFNASKPGLFVINYNIISYNKNFDTFTPFLRSLNRIPDVIILTEI